MPDILKPPPTRRDSATYFISPDAINCSPLQSKDMLAISAELFLKKKGERGGKCLQWWFPKF